MKKRSISQLIISSLLTLGFYELFWLVETRNEMVANFNAKIPRAGFLVIIKGLQSIGIIGLVIVLFVVMPANSKRIDNLQRPSPQCLKEYTDSADSVNNGGPSTVGLECRNTVDNYYADDKTFELSLAYIIGLVVFLPILLWLLVGGWLKPYSIAVEQVTAGTLSSGFTLFLLVITPFTGLFVIQNAFNKISTNNTIKAAQSSIS